MISKQIGERKKADRLQERAPGRIVFAICILFLGVFLVGDTALRSIAIKTITEIKTSDVAIDAKLISPGARARMDILPPASMDARWWVIHTEQLLKDGALRVRHTNLDNAPEGREVHWSSGLVWLLAGISILLSSLTGKPAVDCVVQAAFWAGPLMLSVASVLLGILVARRFGIGLAGVFVLLFGTSPLIYQCFRAGEADHHGIVCTFAVASVLGLLAGGGGVIQRSDKRVPFAGSPLLSYSDAKGWFILAGIMGGAALWVSAATFIPILVGCALGSFGTLMLRDTEISLPAPQLWKVWAATGCGVSLLFYFLEYFPGHMGWRLEVNHPLYALAWLGAGDLLCRFQNKLAGKRFFEHGTKSYLAAAISLSLCLVPVILILARPGEFFWVSDKFLLLLHNEYISEFKSLIRSVNKDSLANAVVEIFLWPVFVLSGLIYLHLRKNLAKSWMALLIFALAPALVMQTLALAQVRWSILAMAMWSLCVLLLLAAYFAQLGSRSRIFIVTFAVILAVANLSFPLISMAALSQAGGAAQHLPKSTIPTVLARDISHRLLQASPSQLPVVLSGPSPSTEFNYYGGIRTLGTLYWENLAGLKKAAWIFAAPTDEQAKALIEKAGATWIVLTTWDNFGSAYVDLLREAGELPINQPPDTFIDRLLSGKTPPRWLRPLYYPIPTGFGIEGEKVLIFQFVPNQTPIQALLYQGIYFYDQSDYSAAENLFLAAAKIEPENPSIQRLLQTVRSQKQTKKNNALDEVPRSKQD